MSESDAVRLILDSAIRVNLERRKFTRIDLQARVKMVAGDRVIDGTLVNLSLNGAFVASDTILEVNTVVTLTICDTDTPRSLNDVRAMVVRTSEKGMGLHFE